MEEVINRHRGQFPQMNQQGAGDVHSDIDRKLALEYKCGRMRPLEWETKTGRDSKCTLV